MSRDTPRPAPRLRPRATARATLAALMLTVSAPAVAAQDWAGPYLGVTLGWSDAAVELQSAGASQPYGSADLSGGLVALTGGHAWQSGAWVYGAEVSVGTAQGSGTYTHGSGSSRMRGSESSQITAGLRLGHAFDRVLVSATAGLAIQCAEVGMTVLPSGRSVGFEEALNGRYLGLSVDVALRDGWSARAEARRYDGLEARTPETDFPGGPPQTILSPATWDFDRTELRLSVLRRF